MTRCGRALSRGPSPVSSGGVVFGVTMVDLGTLESIATIVRADAGSARGLARSTWRSRPSSVPRFGLLVRRQRLGLGETLFWGLSYGAFFWFLGPLTLRPILTGGTLGWSLEAAQSAFPALLGHLVYGAATGLAYAALRQRAEKAWRDGGTAGKLVARGLRIAGVTAAAFFGPTIGGPHALAAATGWAARAAGLGRGARPTAPSPVSCTCS